MFYSQFVLAKKGALGRVWLAAHWDRKLTKAQINATNIEQSVENIIRPDVPMALRMTGHLLLGVSRIHARQVKYLLNDCNEALVKIKMVFRTGEAQADIHPEETVATYQSITLPEGYGEMELSIPDISLDDIAPPENLLNINLATRQRESRPEEMGEKSNEYERDPLRLLPLPEDEEPENLMDQGELPEFNPNEDVDINYPSSIDVSPGNALVGEGPSTPGFTPDGQGYNLPDTTEDPDVQMDPPTPTVLFKKAPKEPKKGITVDQDTILSKQVQKRSLEITTDLIREFNPAPPSKKAMLQREKELAGADSVFMRPCIEGYSSQILDLFSSVYKKNGLPLEIPLSEETRPEEAVGEIDYSQSEIDFGNPMDDPVNDEPLDEFIRSPLEEGEVVKEQREERTRESGEQTYVEAEKWSERTKKMHMFLDKTFSNEVDEISYLKLVEGKNRKVVVGTFFELLVLKSRDIIALEQPKAYGDILVRKTETFASVPLPLPQTVSA